jgi:hypothetical protein
VTQYNQIQLVIGLDYTSRVAKTAILTFLQDDAIVVVHERHV